MDFFAGLLIGIGAMLALRAILLEFIPSAGVEKPEQPPQATTRKAWVQTRNFLYYDGTVMPEIKEDAHEH